MRTAAASGIKHEVRNAIDYLAERPFPVAAAALSFAAAAIHFGVSPDHFDEYAPYGLFFAILGWYQVGWGAMYFARPSRSLAITGAVVNAAVVLVWVWSRTIGLPFGPAPGGPEAVGIADTLASEIEVLLVAGIGVRYAFPGAAERPRGIGMLAVSGVVTAGVLVATLVALAAVGGAMPSMGG